MSTTKQRYAAMPAAGLSTVFSDEIMTRSQTGVGGFLWFPSTNQLYLSPSLWRIFGAAPLFNSVHQDLLHFVHPSHRSRARSELREAIARQEKFFEGIYRVGAAKSDSIRMLLFRATISYNARFATKLQGVAMDVTSIPRLLMGLGGR